MAAQSTQRLLSPHNSTMASTSPIEPSTPCAVANTHATTATTPAVDTAAAVRVATAIKAAQTEFTRGYRDARRLMCVAKMQRLARRCYGFPSPSAADVVAMDEAGGIADSTPDAATARAASSVAAAAAVSARCRRVHNKTVNSKPHLRLLTPNKKHRRADSSKTKYALSKMQKKNLVVRRGRDLLEVIQFFCLNNGCQHNLLEHYLSAGKFHPRPRGENVCGQSCGMCNAEWDDNFLPVRKDGVLRWFDSGEVRDTFPMKANVNNLTETYK